MFYEYCTRVSNTHDFMGNLNCGFAAKAVFQRQLAIHSNLVRFFDEMNAIEHFSALKKKIPCSLL